MSDQSSKDNEQLSLKSLIDKSAYNEIVGECIDSQPTLSEDHSPYQDFSYSEKRAPTIYSQRWFQCLLLLLGINILMYGVLSVESEKVLSTELADAELMREFGHNYVLFASQDKIIRAATNSRNIDDPKLQSALHDFEQQDKGALGEPARPFDREAFRVQEGVHYFEPYRSKRK